MTHSEKEGFVLSFLASSTDNFALCRRLGVSHARLCRWYRGSEELDRQSLDRFLTVLGVDKADFEFLVSQVA